MRQGWSIPPRSFRIQPTLLITSGIPLNFIYPLVSPAPARIVSQLVVAHVLEFRTKKVPLVLTTKDHGCHASPEAPLNLVALNNEPCWSLRCSNSSEPRRSRVIANLSVLATSIVHDHCPTPTLQFEGRTVREARRHSSSNMPKQSTGERSCLQRSCQMTPNIRNWGSRRGSKLATLS